MEEKKEAIAVFTSGGDAPGMNAGIRAVARVGMHYGHTVYAIYEGYEGLIEGGDYIRPLEWSDVSLMMHRGGTFIGSARSSRFREHHYRLQAAENLVKKHITKLICIGGDGSLTGANIFKQEWPSLLGELVETGRVTQELANECADLDLVGLVGSIDNDMVYDGEMTIGTDTALHRIVEAIDAVSSTATSHQRTFVMEIMGRHCGYLAWGAAVACGADYVLLPEAPPEENWFEQLCAKLQKRREMGRRKILVIVAEGAIDRNLNPINGKDVARMLSETGKHDTRFTVLGHVQRGGMTSAYDRLMTSVVGAAAVEKLLSCKNKAEATIVGWAGTEVIYAPLVQAVADTQLVASLTKEKKFEEAMHQRGKHFERDYEYHKSINSKKPQADLDPAVEGLAVAILHVGAPCSGMNSAARAATRMALNAGYKVYGVANGFIGFEIDDMRELTFMDVHGWSYQGGSKLGTNRTQPTDFAALSRIVQRRKIGAMLVIGGFEGYTAAMALKAAQATHSSLKVPIVHIPATISNNCPGTEWSLGSDTALNAVCDALDRCKVSADASRHRVFLVETQGGKCGFLASMSALAGGAHRAMIPEEEPTMETIERDILAAKNRQAKGGRYTVLVKSEKCSPYYNLDFITSAYLAESRGQYSVRECSLGHLCQGLYPSPLDRIRAVRLACHSLQYITQQIKAKKAETLVVGFKRGDMIFTDVDELAKETDFKERVWTQHWHLTYVPLVHQLAGCEAESCTVDRKQAYNIDVTDE